MQMPVEHSPRSPHGSLNPFWKRASNRIMASIRGPASGNGDASKASGASTPASPLPVGPPSTDEAQAAESPAAKRMPRERMVGAEPTTLKMTLAPRIFRSMRMKALLGIIAAGLVLAAAGSASAQGYGPGYYQQPPPPPPPGVYRSGLVLGFDIGVGAIAFTDCDECESLGGLAWGLRLGGMVGPNLAILGDVSGVSHFLEEEDATLNSVTVTGILRGWLSRIIYLEGGVGIGWMQLDDPYGTIADTRGGFGLIAGVGIEVLQTSSFVLDIRGRVSASRFDYGDGVGVANWTLAAGFTWY